jgi:2-methylcitrate dehydratase PrpD
LSATVELARFVAELNPERIPGEVLHQSKRCLIDWLGVALAGSTDPGTELLCDLAAEIDTAEHATVVGRGCRQSLPWAALVNGFMSHVLDFDDTYNPQRTTVHGSAPVWPVVLALSERRPLDGGRAMTAFIAGFETEVRIALAAGPAHYEQGWHVTGTVGHFGAAAAGASVLGLSSDRVANALGAAGTQAAGLKGVYGSMGKALHPGKAAMDGLLAALLAEKGFLASKSIIEGKHGFLAVMSADFDAGLVTRGLGVEWTVLDDGFKPYACGSLTHPTIEAVIELGRRNDIHPVEIESIEAAVNDYVSWVTAKEEPKTGLEAKFSIYHCAAIAALDGAASVAQFEDGRVNDADAVAMRRRVRIVVDASLPKDAARVTMTLSDGRRLQHEVTHNKGTPAKPMTDAEIESKFLDLAAPHLGGDIARDVVRRGWDLERCGDVADIARLCGGRRSLTAPPRS